MKSINKVIMIGNLATEPEVRETQRGVKVANFRLATNRDWVTDDDPSKVKADFHNVVAWDKLAEVVGSYLSKGSGVYIEGRLQNRSYEAADQAKRFVTEIRMDVLNILTWKQRGDDQRPETEGPEPSGEDAA
jgi:single-strand DNA-binding protein